MESRKIFSDQAVELTQRIMEKYWLGDITLLLDYLSEDVLWIGSTNQEYIHGKDKMIERLNQNHEEMPHVYLDEQEYEAVYNDSKTCTVVGRYRAFTNPKQCGLALSEKQRFTFLWVKEKDKVLIKHIHLSNILKMQ